MIPLDPTTEINITLQAQEWNQLIAMINVANAWFNGEGPYRAAAPLTQKIAKQAQAAADQPAAGKANGEDLHVSH
jgi:hypothetical protein